MRRLRVACCFMVGVILTTAEPALARHPFFGVRPVPDPDCYSSEKPPDASYAPYYHSVRDLTDYDGNCPEVP